MLLDRNEKFAVIHLHGFENRCGTFGLVIGEGKIVHHKNRLVVKTVGERTLESELFHLGIELEAIIARFRAEAVTAVTPNRISDTAGTGAAESFLTERFSAAAGNESAGFS